MINLFAVIGLSVITVMIYALIVRMITFANDDLAETSFMIGGFEAVVIALFLYERLG